MKINPRRSRGEAEACGCIVGLVLIVGLGIAWYQYSRWSKSPAAPVPVLVASAPSTPSVDWGSLKYAAAIVIFLAALAGSAAATNHLPEGRAKEKLTTILVSVTFIIGEGFMAYFDWRFAIGIALVPFAFGVAWVFFHWGVQVATGFLSREKVVDELPAGKPPKEKDFLDEL